MPPEPTPSSPPASPLETAVLAHTGIYAIGATWAFGGNAGFVRPYLGAWGTLGILLTIWGLFSSDGSDRRPRLLRSLWPVLAFNALTLVACFKVGFRPIHSGTELIYLPRQVPFWMPSSALPKLAIDGLWLFDGIYFSAFNLSFAIKTRARLRRLLVIMLVNTLVLAVFGTVQKLVHADGLYFGRVHSPQPYFFASFIYDNHWGAYIILVTGVCLGLMWHYADRADERGFFHSPAFGAAVGLLFLFITVPLSGARTCSALLAGFLTVALIRWLYRQQRRQTEAGVNGGVGRWAPLFVMISVLLGAAATWYVAEETITQRAAKTVVQVQEFKQLHGLGSRSVLYRATWKMASDRLMFGWGMGSFPTVFQMYNNEEINRQDLLPHFYHDAHSDWLQAMAEHGLIGAALLGCCALVPLLRMGAAAWSNRLSRYCFAGCTVVLLYAWMEFPFGNYAVALTWYLLFFAAARYGILTPQRIRIAHDRAEPDAAGA